MSEQPSFVHTHLEYKLQELLAAALSDISGIEYIDISNGIRSASEDIRKESQALGILK